MHVTQSKDRKTTETSDDAERRFETQEETGSDPGDESKTSGTLPAMGDTDE